MKKQFWLAFVFSFFGPTLLADEYVRLQWKLNPGDEFYVEEVLESKSRAKTRGKEVKQEDRISVVYRYRVLAKGSKGDITLERTIESGKILLPKVEDEDPDPFEGLKSTALKITLNPAMEVLQVEGFEEVLKKSGGANAPASAVLFSDEAVRKAFEAGFPAIPARSVRKGEKWERRLVTPFGPFGECDCKISYTYEGKTPEGHKIAHKWAISIKPGAEKGAFPPRIKALSINNAETSGVYYFNAEKGKVVRSDGTSSMKGTGTIFAAGKDHDAEVEVFIGLKTRLLDRPPQKN